MSILPRISNYFRNFFGENDQPAMSKVECVPTLEPIKTPGSLISCSNFNIFDKNLKFIPTSNSTFNQIYKFTPMNFDMFNYRGFEDVSLNSEKEAKSEYNLDFWKENGYNEEKGVALVNKAKSKVKKKSQSQCAAFVRRAINKTFYGNEKGEHYKSFKRACIVGDEFLAHDKNFKKINVDMTKIQPEDIPAGAIVIYPSKGYSSHSAGHIEISDGNGRGISDFTSRKLCQNWGKRKNPAEIWIPV